jgi:hypothetical protein
MISAFARIRLIVAILLVAVVQAKGQSTLQMRYRAQGPSSIRYGNDELLINGPIAVRQRAYFPAEMISVPPALGEPAIRFDSTASRLETIAATIQILDAMTQNGDSAGWGAFLTAHCPRVFGSDFPDSLYRVLGGTHPDLAWAQLVVTEIFFCVSFTGTRSRASLGAL